MCLLQFRGTILLVQCFIDFGFYFFQENLSVFPDVIPFHSQTLQKLLLDRYKADKGN